MNTKTKKYNSVSDLPRIPWWENIYWSIRIFFDRVYWNLYYTFVPQHQSLRKAIPREWQDLDAIVENFLCAVIISFVEEEGGLEQIDMIEEYERSSIEKIESDWGSVKYFNDYRDSRLPDYQKLREIYNWVTTGRKSMQNYIDNIYARKDYLDFSSEIEKAEKRMQEKDTEMLADLIRLRKYLWT